MHPLMLPILFLDNFITILDKELSSQLTERYRNDDQIQKATDANFLDSVDFSLIHQALIESHNALTNSLVGFIRDSMRQLKRGLEDVIKMIPNDRRVEFENRTEELKGCVEQMDVVAMGLISSRERLVYRVDMQLKVVRIITASHISGKA